MKDATTQTEKRTLINDCLRVWSVSWKFHVPTIYDFLVIHVKFLILSKSSLLFNTCYSFFFFLNKLFKDH